MFCESYRKTLSEAALRDERLPADVQAHLASCASCRESLSDEKAVFGLIEAELRIRTNGEMPASLVPRVRQEIASLPAARTWRVPVPAYIASGLAVGAIALWFAVRTRVSPVKPGPSAHNLSLPAQNEPRVSQKENGSGQTLGATGRKIRRSPQAVPHGNPEVLVSAEEYLGLQRYAASFRNVKSEAPAVIKGNVAAEIEPLQIASVDVKGLSIEPLQSGDSD